MEITCGGCTKLGRSVACLGPLLAVAIFLRPAEGALPAIPAPDVGALLLGAVPPDPGVVIVVRGYREPLPPSSDFVVDADLQPAVQTPQEAFDECLAGVGSSSAGDYEQVVQAMEAEPGRSAPNRVPAASFRLTAYYNWERNDLDHHELRDWIALAAFDEPLAYAGRQLRDLPDALTDNFDRPMYGFYTGQYVVYSNNKSLRDDARAVLDGRKSETDLFRRRLKIRSRAGTDGVFGWSNVTRASATQPERSDEPDVVTLAYTRNKPEHMEFSSTNPASAEFLRDCPKFARDNEYEMFERNGRLVVRYLVGKSTASPHDGIQGATGAFAISFMLRRLGMQ